MGQDYSYMLYFKKDLLWVALKAVVNIAEPHNPPTIIRFPNHELPIPLESMNHQILNYDDPELEFATVLYFSEDKYILSWKSKITQSHSHYDSVGSKQISVGYIYLTISTDLTKRHPEGKTSNLVLFNFGTTGTKMSTLFLDSVSIRKTFVELLERVPGVCGVFNCEDFGELFWKEGQTVSEKIENSFMLPPYLMSTQEKLDHRTNNFKGGRWLEKGYGFYAMGRFSEAIECYDEALKINPKDSDAWFNKGLSFANLGHFDEAIKCYNEALKIKPQDAEAWYNKAISLYNFGWLDEAIECYDKTIKINPRYALAWLSKGSLLEKRGDLEASIICYKRFIEVATTEHSKLVEAIRQRLQQMES